VKSLSIYRFQAINKRVKHVKPYLILESEEPKKRVTRNPDGSIRDIDWALSDGRLHRIGGPAVEEYQNGSLLKSYWYVNGLRHRVDGPAVDDLRGYRVWYQNDERHREDGPAVEHENGRREWWVNGRQLSPEKFYSERIERISEPTKKEKLTALLELIELGLLSWEEESTLDAFQKELVEEKR
jgi:hypothetical protein